jgi:hypothetical protein
MNKQNLLLIGLSMVLLIGCKKGDDESDSSLAISVSPEAPYILPVPLRSCKAEGASSTTTDLAANTIEYTRFKYRWAGTGTYTMSAIIMRFNSGLLQGGKLECDIAGDELNFVLPASGRVLDPTETAEQSARCSLRCGGITVSGNVSYAYIPGVMKVVGIETDDTTGDSRPIVVETPIAMTYQKF